MRWLVVVLLAHTLLGSSKLEENIDAVLASTPASRGAFWGIRIVRIGSGQVVYQREADRCFAPASNAKLFSTALALARLGPDHRFQTLVTADQLPDPAGRVAGDLILVGGGDPTLSGREIPYNKGGLAGDPLRALEELAEQVVSKGARRIDGDIVGDDTAYVWDPYPAGWSLADMVYDYAAPVSALTINENKLSVAVRPGARDGEPARLFLSPPLEYYAIDNRVNTAAGSETAIHLARTPGSRQLRLWGTVRIKTAGVSYALAIDDPALFAASVFLDALSRRGVDVTGRAVARHRFRGEVADATRGSILPYSTPGVELARRTSPPLLETLRVIDKVSQNLQAEMVLREVGRARRGIGSLAAGLEEMKLFLAEVGLSPNEYSLQDASGLSGLNLVTPVAVTKLLVHMYKSELRDQWIGLLPSGGEDGTLGGRFTKLAEGLKVRAKTGSMAHVGALSGYLESRAGEVMAFSIVANNYNGPSSEVRKLIDRICVLVLE
jgi:serine-type D-Ala-D-Ala carboxypeptidase/endopeptidase (penicillin-binding protein 4)